MPEMRRVPVDPKRKFSRGDLATTADEAAEALKNEEGCGCPYLDPADWDGVESDWSDIAFLKGATTAVMGVPFGYQSSRDELKAKAATLGFELPEDAMVLLGEGKFRRPIMVEVEAPPDAQGVERPGGIAFTRIVPGKLGTLGKLVDESVGIALGKYRRKPDKTWIWYLTCHECSEERDYETLIVCHYRQRK